jgi:peptide/nickel transport system substrate-binding protein
MRNRFHGLDDFSLPVSRRGFLQSSAIGAGVLAGVLPVRAQTPKPGGKLRAGIAYGETLDNLDIATVNNPMTQVVTFALRNLLVEIDDKYKAIPELAESWNVDNDAKRWSFKIRKGVTFHDGRPFTPQDALYSIQYHSNADSKSGARALFSTLTSVKVDGDSLVFDLSEGTADFPYVLADYHLQMVPDGHTDFNSGLGTGAYKLERFEPGVRANLVKNPNYWKAGRGHFDEIEIISIKDAAARQNAFLNGEVDFIDSLDPATTKLMERAPGVKVDVINGMQHYSFPMQVDKPPFNNPDVRLALKYAIDREDMVTKILSGYGKVGNDQPISSVNRYYDASLEQRVYDPEKAKFHLKKAGAEGLKVQLHASDAAYTGALASAQLYREHAARAGIDLEVVSEPADGYWSNVWLVKPWMITIWYGRPVEDAMFTLGYAAGADWNECHWDNPKFNELLKSARIELDDAKRRSMYGEMQSLVRDDGGAVIPVFAAYLQARKDTVAAGPIASNYPLDGFRFAERWWQA